MIIDFHTHLHEGLPGKMASAGVDKAVVLIPIARDIHDAKGNIIPLTLVEVATGNLQVIYAGLAVNALSEHAGKFLPFAWMRPDMPDAFAKLDEYIAYSCHGVKLNPVLDGFSLMDERLVPIIDAARRFDVPVMIHTGWHPEGSVADVGVLAKRNADVNFVIAHMKEEWGVNVRKSHIEVASKLDNVWLECSYAEHPRRVAEAVSAIGADRILFGSDCPFGNGDMAWDMTKVTAAPISETDKRKILGENAAKLLRI